MFKTAEEGTLNKNAFVRESYVFVSWNTDAFGEGTEYADEATVSFGMEEGEEIILYAQWEEEASSEALEENNSDYQFEELPDGTVKILKYTGSEAVVFVPDRIDDKPVTVIGQAAFADNTVITTAELPDTVRKIDAYAFANCPVLSAVVIPDSVEAIGTAAFMDCRELQNISLPAGLSVISDGLFMNCSQLFEIEIPAGVKRIGESAFNSCTQLSYVTLCEGITEIDLSAFLGCRNLWEIELPDSLTSIGREAFRDCSSLMQLSIPEGVTALPYMALGGCTSLSELSAYGLTRIDAFALDGCSALRKMDTPNLQSMSGTAFGLLVINRVESLDLSNAESISFELMGTFIKLKEITLGKNLKTIKTGAFSLVPSGLSVRYYGTAEEWAAIEVGPLNSVISKAEPIWLTPVSGIVLGQSEVTITVNDYAILEARVLPEDASDQRIRWTSSDTRVAEVDDDGFVIAAAPGTALITARTFDGGFTAVCTVTVMPDRIYIKGLAESYAYTGKPIKPVVEVYDGTVRLAEKTDYTLSYKNNTKAADQDDVRAPTIVVTGRGKYTAKKEVTFTIAKASLEEAAIEEITLVQKKTPSKLKVTPKVTWNGTALKSSDYTIDYNGWNQIDTGDFPILLAGAGNFTGSVPVVVHVLPYGTETTPVTKLSVKSSAISYHPGLSLRAVLAESGFTVMDGKTELTEDRDYVLSDDRGCDSAGACTFVLTGRTIYTGTRTVSVTIKGTALSSAKTSGQAIYDGSPKKLEDGIVVSAGKAVLVKDQDYEVLEATYENNINAGKAYVTIRGKGGYTGTKKVPFTISPDTSEKKVEISEAYYTKSGVVPSAIITCNGNLLRPGADYKLSCSDNRKAGTATVTVKYQGNYKGTPDYRTSYEIQAMPIYAITAFAQDPVWSNRKGNFIPKLTLLDENGKALKAGTDYEKEIQYFDVNDQPIDKSAVLDPGSYVRAIITGKGNYSEQAEVYFHVIEKSQSFAGASITLRDQEYNGTNITPGPEDIQKAAIKVNGQTVNLVYGRDYELYTAVNNLNQGTAKAVFIGIGDYAGYKTVNFRIKKRSVAANWIEELFAALGF